MLAAGTLEIAWSKMRDGQKAKIRGGQKAGLEHI
jgi:hypothetical protein